MRTLQYVVLHHTDYGEPHFDLMLEQDDTGPLLTWRCSDWPITDATRCTPLFAHRRAYLTLEGPVSGGRGYVRRVASGTYDVLRSSVDQIVVVIDGRTTTLLFL